MGHGVVRPLLLRTNGDDRSHPMFLGKIDFSSPKNSCVAHVSIIPTEKAAIVNEWVTLTIS